MKHKIIVMLVQSSIWRRIGGGPVTVAQWQCRCGKRGAEQRIGTTTAELNSAKDRSAHGGHRHLRAELRKS